MRHVWKGLVIGALTGAAVGLGLEAVDGGTDHLARGANKASDALSDRGAVAVDKTKQAAAKAGDVLADKASEAARSGKHAAESVRGAASTWASQRAT